LMVSSIMPTSVCGKNKKAGDVDSELRCTGCSGGCEVFVGLVGIDGGGGVDFGGDAWQGPNDGIGLILVFYLHLPHVGCSCTLTCLLF
jgi:hypothetical protein